jgi:hypothetical protein
MGWAITPVLLRGTKAKPTNFSGAALGRNTALVVAQGMLPTAAVISDCAELEERRVSVRLR